MISVDRRGFLGRLLVLLGATAVPKPEPSPMREYVPQSDPLPAPEPDYYLLNPTHFRYSQAQAFSTSAVPRLDLLLTGRPIPRIVLTDAEKER